MQRPPIAEDTGKQKKQWINNLEDYKKEVNKLREEIKELEGKKKNIKEVVETVISDEKVKIKLIVEETEAKNREVSAHLGEVKREEDQLKAEIESLSKFKKGEEERLAYELNRARVKEQALGTDRTKINEMAVQLEGRESLIGSKEKAQEAEGGRLSRLKIDLDEIAETVKESERLVHEKAKDVFTKNRDADAKKLDVDREAERLDKYMKALDVKELELIAIQEKNEEAKDHIREQWGKIKDTQANNKLAKLHLEEERQLLNKKVSYLNGREAAVVKREKLLKTSLT